MTKVGFRRPLSLVSIVVCAVLFVAVPTMAQIDGGTIAKDRVELRSFHSAALDGTDHMAVYLPRAYQNDHRHYPVIYFLHGLPGRDGSYNGARVRWPPRRATRPAPASRPSWRRCGPCRACTSAC